MHPTEALTHWRINGPVMESPDAGLINKTWLVGDPPAAVLQWLNPIFSPRTNENIDAVTQRLESQGMETTRVLKTNGGALWVADEEACWRMLSFVEGETIHNAPTVNLAAQAGALVGQFHAALSGWDHTFVGNRRNIHDTPLRMSELRDALDACSSHPLSVQARALGTRILSAWDSWDGPLELPNRWSHGDLKLSNIRFRGDAAVCLIDLDTVGLMPLSCEMGDAWRSWCNRGGEDNPEDVRFDVSVFEASARAYLRQAPDLSPLERQSLVPGIERICLELSARFCKDAVENSYFRENRTKHPQVGMHNLVRAQSQFRLAQKALEQRTACEAIVANASGR